MNKILASKILSTLLLLAVLTLATHFQPVKASSLIVDNVDSHEDPTIIDKMVLEWDLTCNPSPTEPDVPYDVAVDSSDNIIVVGLDGSTLGDQWRITKFDKDGNEISPWPFLYNPSDGSDRPFSVAVDSSNNIIAVGHDKGGTQDRWKMIKLDENKSLIWEKTEDFFSTPDYGETAFGVAIDTFDTDGDGLPDDSIIVVGFDAEDGLGKAKWRVIKYDNSTSGLELWNLPFDPNPSMQDIAYGVAVQSSGNIIVVGTIDTVATKLDWQLKKLDPNGNLITACDKVILSTAESDVPYDVAVDSNDNIIVVGYEGVGYGDARWRVMKFYPDGTEMWSWAPSPDWSNEYDVPWGVTVDSYDNIIVVGYDNSGSDRKWRIMKFDGQSTTANPIWEDTSINPLVDVDSQELAHSVAALEGADIVVVGSDDRPSADDWERQWRIVKFAYTYARETHNLVETIQAWNLPKGLGNSLTSKLDGVIHLLAKGNEEGAVHGLGALIKHVEAVRGKKLTYEQADYLIGEAERIIDLVNG